MGCRNDYLEQNEFEKENQTVAKFLVWLKTKYNILCDIELLFETDESLERDAETYYCKTDRTNKLCKICKIIDDRDETANQILYNGRDATSRKLAEWWEKHKVLDSQREEKEKEILRNKIKDLLKDYTDTEIIRAINLSKSGIY